MAMDLPVSDRGPVKEDGGAPYRCAHCDTEVVHKLAQLLLPGLATACVDNTTGDLFNRPASVAVEARREMVDYVTARSESFVSDSLTAADPPPSDDPAEILSSFIDDFVDSKRSLLARVSGWLLSDSREDKIDDFVLEMESNRFWSIDRREAVAESLLRNVDYKHAHHCPAGFDTVDELHDHAAHCGLRTLVGCGSDGCKTRFCAARAEAHERACPYRVVPCEQGCGESLVRREMDRHCITVCPMRLVNCPFFQVGCQSAFPRCTLERHCTEFLNSHLLCVLQVIHKHETSVDELKQRVHLLEKSQSLNELAEALDVRSLTLAVKEQEAKIKKLEHGLSKLNESS